MLRRWCRNLIFKITQATVAASVMMTPCFYALLESSVGGFNCLRSCGSSLWSTWSTRRGVVGSHDSCAIFLGERAVPPDVLGDVYDLQSGLYQHQALKTPYYTFIARKYGVVLARLLIDPLDFPPVPCDGGGGSDVFHSKFRGVDAAVKVIRQLKTEPVDTREGVLLPCHEASMFVAASHPLVLPIMGVFLGADAKHLVLVSRWCRNGHMKKYLRDRPQELPRILTELAHVICHLHSLGIVHNDLHFSNVLISDDGHVQLADFGLSDWTDAIEPHPRVLWGRRDYMSPEKYFYSDNLQSPYRCRLSDDMFAFGSLCFEAYTGRLPFTSDKPHYTPYTPIQNGDRPPRPAEHECRIPLPDTVWDMILRCWSTQPLELPSAVQARQVLLSFYFPGQTPEVLLMS